MRAMRTTARKLQFYYSIWFPRLLSLTYTCPACRVVTSRIAAAYSTAPAKCSEPSINAPIPPTGNKLSTEPSQKRKISITQKLEHFLSRGEYRKARDLAVTRNFRHFLLSRSVEDLEKLLKLVENAMKESVIHNQPLNGKHNGDQPTAPETEKQSKNHLSDTGIKSIDLPASLITIRRIIFSALIVALARPRGIHRKEADSTETPLSDKQMHADIQRAQELVGGDVMRVWKFLPIAFVHKAAEFSLAVALPDARAYHALAVAQITRGDLDTVQRTLDGLLKADYKPLRTTFNELAKARAKMWQWDGVKWVWEKMQKIQEMGGWKENALNGVQQTRGEEGKGDDRVLSAFVRLHMRDLDHDIMDKVITSSDVTDFDEMDSVIASRKADAAPARTKALRGLLRVFASTTNGLPRAMDVYRLMECQVGLEMDDYTLLISALAAGEEYAKVLEIADDMSKAKVLPDATTTDTIKMAGLEVKRRELREYDNQIRAALRRDPPHLKLAYYHFKEAFNKGRVLREEIMNDLIMRHVESGYYAEPIEFYKTMKKWKQLPSTEAYGALISSALKNDDMKRVWSYYDEMLTSDASDRRPTARICSRILSAIAGQLRGDLGNRAVKVQEEFERMLKDGVQPDIEMLNVVLAAHAAVGDADTFKRMVSSYQVKGVAFNEYTLHALIEARLNAGKLDDAVDEFRQLTEEGMVPLRATINTLIAHSHDEVEARRLADEAEKRWNILPDASTKNAFARVRRGNEIASKTISTSSGPSTDLAVAEANMRLAQYDIPHLAEFDQDPSVTPDVVTYTTLITKHLARNETAQAEQIFERMQQEHGTHPTAITYHVFIQHFSKTGDVGKMKEYLSHMDNVRFVPLLKTYASLINGYSLAADISAAEEVLDHMSSRQVVPDVVIMNALMEARIRVGDLPGARQWRSKMIKKWKLSPNAVTFNILIDGYAKKGTRKALDTGIKLLRAMETDRDPRVRPFNHVPYTTLIAGCGRVGDMTLAQTVWESMRNHNIEPALETWNAMIGAYCAVGDLKSAGDTFTKAFATSPGLCPDTVTFLPLIKAHTDKDDAAGVDFWLNTMIQGMGLSPSTSIQNIVLGWLCRSGKTDVAKKWYEVMRTTGRANSATVVAALDGFGKNGDVKEAEEWFEMFSRDGVKVDVKAWTALLNAYAKKGDLTGMRDVVTRMVTTDVEPNAVTYLAMMDAYAKAGQAANADRTLAVMKARGIQPSDENMVALMDARERSGDFSGVQKIWKEFVGASETKRNPIPESAACIYLDAVGRHSTVLKLLETWTYLQNRSAKRSHELTENQLSSLVEALVRLGDQQKAVEEVQKWVESNRGVGVKVGVGLVGGVLGKSGMVEARRLFEKIKGILGDEVAKEVDRKSFQSRKE